MLHVEVRTKWTSVAGPMKHTPNITVVLKRTWGMDGSGGFSGFNDSMHFFQQIFRCFLSLYGVGPGGFPARKAAEKALSGSLEVTTESTSPIEGQKPGTSGLRKKTKACETGTKGT